MKKNILFLICCSAVLLACDSATVIDPDAPTATGDSGNGSTGIDAGNTGNTTTGDTTDTGGTVADNETTTGSDGSNPNTTSNTGATGNTSSNFGTDLDGVTTSATATGTVNSVGLIKLEPLGVSADRSRGLFGNLPESRSEQEIRDWFIPPQDACVVETLADALADTGEFQVLDQSATLVSAGDSLVLTDDNGTYATLQQTAGSTGPLYQPETDLNQPAGLNLSVDIQGDQFTAFPGIAVPPVPALQMQSPGVGGNVDVATFFQWQPNNEPGSVIELYTSGTSSVSNEAIFIGCSLVDDGLFTFPEDVQALMGPGYNDDFTSYLRIVYNVAADDDSIVFIANSVSDQR